MTVCCPKNKEVSKMPQEVIKKIIWMLPGMNTLAEALGITCTADIGLMSIEYTCYDGEKGFTQSLCLTNTGVNTLKLNRLEHFIQNFEAEGKHMSGEQLHTFLDNIEKTHGLYSPPALELAAAEIGAVANTLRLELVDLANIPPTAAASWFASAILIIAALPLGLIFARILTDKGFRYCT